MVDKESPQMIEASRTHPDEPATPAWAPEKPRLRKGLEELLMRAAGRGAAGLNALLGSRAGGALGILTYHRTAEAVPGIPRPLHNVAPSVFRRQLAGLLDRGFRVWPLAKALDHLSRGVTIPRQTIVITFDDGFASVYHHAWPVLRELGLPATVFLCTAYLDSAAPFPFDAWGMEFRDSAPVDAYRPLTLEECRRMGQDGLIEFGAHTHTHRDLRNQPEEFQHDLQTSVNIVRELFDLDRVTFAFPYGSLFDGFAGGRLAAAARGAGVVCALTTEPALVTAECDPFHWGRFNVFAWDTAATLAGKLEGWYSWAPRLRKQCARACLAAGHRLQRTYALRRDAKAPESVT